MRTPEAIEAIEMKVVGEKRMGRQRGERTEDDTSESIVYRAVSLGLDELSADTK